MGRRSRDVSLFPSISFAEVVPYHFFLDHGRFRTIRLFPLRQWCVLDAALIDAFFSIKKIFCVTFTKGGSTSEVVLRRNLRYKFVHEIVLNFTNGAKSSSLKTGKVAGQALKSYEIDASRKISDFYINQVDSTGEIHGLRILDNFGEYLVNEHWQKGTT